MKMREPQVINEAFYACKYGNIFNWNFIHILFLSFPYHIIVMHNNECIVVTNLAWADIQYAVVLGRIQSSEMVTWFLLICFFFSAWAKWLESGLLPACLQLSRPLMDMKKTDKSVRTRLLSSVEWETHDMRNHYSVLGIDNGQNSTFTCFFSVSLPLFLRQASCPCDRWKLWWLAQGSNSASLLGESERDRERVVQRRERIRVAERWKTSNSAL